MLKAKDILVRDELTDDSEFGYGWGRRVWAEAEGRIIAEDYVAADAWPHEVRASRRRVKHEAIRLLKQERRLK
jgi:hypothetical protein